MKKIPGLRAGSRRIPGFPAGSRRIPGLPAGGGVKSYAYADGDTIPGIVPSTEREGGSPAKNMWKV